MWFLGSFNTFLLRIQYLFNKNNRTLQIIWQLEATILNP